MATRKPRRKKKIEPADLPIAEVLWVDAEDIGDVGWNDLDELLTKAAEPCPVMRSVGYVLHHDESHISLLSTIGPQECSSLEKVPAEFLKSVAYLKGEQE